MRHRPVLNRSYWIGFTLLLFAVAIPAYAGPNILDEVGQTYRDASGGWGTVLVPIAKSLFMKLALIELLWSAIWWVIERDDPNQVIVAVLRKIMPLMFFWAILLNFDTWIPTVIDSFSQAGQQAGNLPALTPSGVLDRGLEVATKICNVANEIGLFSGNASKFILAGLAALGILLCFGVIAGQMLVTLIESYIVVSGGVLFLGFAGSRWTTTFSEKYISYAVGVGVKLFVTYLIIGAGQHLSDTWAAKITEEMVVADYMTILVGSLVYMFLAWQIPALASSMLSGTVSMTLGAAAATAGTMAAGAAGAAGLAQAGLVSGAGSVAGAMQAGNAAISHAKEGGAKNLATVAGGAVGALASAGMQAAGEAIRGLGANSGGGGLAERIGNSTASLREANAAGAPAANVPGAQPRAPFVTPEIGSALGSSGGASATPERPTPAAPAGAAAGQGAPAAPAGSQGGSAASGAAAAPSAPASSVIDTSGNVSQALADRDAGNPSPSGAAAAAPAASSAQPAAPTTAGAEASPAEGSAAASSPAGESAAPGSAATSAAAPAAPAAPAPSTTTAPSAPREDRPNALQQLSEHAQALGNMPNDSAAGAGVQINLKHD